MKTTYATLPYFAPEKGAVISQSQLEAMCEHSWEQPIPVRGGLLVDFQDDERHSWFAVDTGNRTVYGSFMLVPTFVGNKKFYVVTETAY